MLNHFKQADRIELRIVEMLFFEQARMHFAAGDARCRGDLRRRFHAFGFKTGSSGSGNEIAARAADIDNAGAAVKRLPSRERMRSSRCVA